MSIIVSSKPWWNRDFEGERHPRLVALVKDLYSRQINRYLTFRRNMSIYEYGYRGTMRMTAKERFVDDQVLFFNMAGNAIDTYVSSMCTPQLSAMAMTEGGTYSDRQRAKFFTRAIEGSLEETGFAKNKYFAIRDYALVGRGITKLFIHDGKLCAERVLPLDILVDDSESRLGQPRTIYQRLTMDKFQAAEIFGKDSPEYVGSSADRKKAILAATNFVANLDDDADVYDMDTSVTLIEAYRLPSYADAGDGRHTICVDGHDILDEEWLPFFPYATFCPKPPEKGWWGVPIMRNIAPAQRERERTDYVVQKSIRRMGGSHWLVHTDADMDVEQISNDSGDIYKWSGTIPPQTISPTPINQQIIDYRESIAQDMLRFIGRSPFSAQSQLPPGMVNASGRALNTLEQVDNKRDVVDHAELERYTKEYINVSIGLIRKIVEKEPDYEVKYARGQHKYDSFKWKEVLMPEEKCVFRVYPISSLSQNPSAKFDELEKMFNAGVITMDQFKRQIGIPDIESEIELDQANVEIIQSNLDHMIMTGEYLAVEPFDKPDAILDLGGKFYNVCRRTGVPEERLQLIRNYLLDAQAMMERANVGGTSTVTGSQPGSDVTGAGTAATVTGAPPTISGGSA